MLISADRDELTEYVLSVSEIVRKVSFLVEALEGMVSGAFKRRRVQRTRYPGRRRSPCISPSLPPSHLQALAMLGSGEKAIALPY